MVLPSRRDLLVAVVAGVLVIVGTPLSAGRWPGPVGLALVVLGALVLAWRHVAPFVVLVGVALPVALYYWLDQPDGPAGLLVAFAVYTVAGRAGRVGAVGVGVAVIVAWFGLEWLLAEGPVSPPRDSYLWIVAVVACGVAGGAAREVAAQRAEADLQRRVEAERLRIARDVHDIVSHSLSMIAVQAGVGVHVADRRPEEAAACLRAIQEASGAALGELRATLRLLRDGDGDADGDAGERDDAPRDRLDDLLAVAARVGIAVRVRGALCAPGSAETDEVVVRIVREAVTNVVRHAPAARSVEVDVERDGTGVRVRVCDDGGPVPPPTPGQGLRGLTELAASAGGSLRWRSTGEGFVVEATLPGREAPAPGTSGRGR